MYGWPDYGEGQVGDDLKEAWLTQFHQAFKDMAREPIDLAVAVWIQKGWSGRFPQPSDLYKLAEDSAAEIRLIAWRLEKAVRDAAPAVVREKTPEDIQAVKDMLAAMKGPDGRIHLEKPIPNNPGPSADRHTMAENLRKMAGDE